MKCKPLLLTALLISTCSHASTWTYLAKSPSGDKSYVLPTTGSELFPVLWYKKTTAKGSTLSLSKDVIDCRKNRYSIKEITRYNQDGSVESSNSYIFNAWKEITPDSLAEYEYKFACHHPLTL